MCQSQQHETMSRLDHWARQLEGSRPAELTHDKPRSATIPSDIGREEFTSAASLSIPLYDYCNNKKTIPGVVLLGAFRAAHFRLTAAKDGTIGAHIAFNRTSVGWQYIRSLIHDNESFESLVQQIQATTEASHGNHNPLSGTVEDEVGQNTLPVVRTTFTFLDLTDDEGHHFDQKLGEGPSVTAFNREVNFELHLVQSDKGLSGHVLYDRNVFYRDTITSMIAIFSEILRQGLTCPRVPIASLDLSDVPVPFQSYDRSTIRWTNYQRESSIVNIFRRQVAVTPNVIAVKDDSVELTYAELDRQSDRLSRWLRQQGLPAESLVGVYMPRSCKTIVAFLAILKASLAYLPLDIKAPLGRTETILASIPGVSLLVLEGDTPMATTKIRNVHAVRLQDVLDEDVTEHDHDCAEPTATSLAYVMFTSGSTGKPKGVMAEHRGIIRLAKQEEIASMPAGTAMAHLANIAFDASTWEIYTAILNGGTLVCIDAMTVLDATKLRTKFARDSIRYTKLTPALLQQCLQQAPEMLKSLDVLLTSGDRLHPHTALKARLHTGGRFFNAYGPTESTGHSTCFEIPATSNTIDCFADTVPIGQAIGNSGAAVVDAQQRVVPLGVIGELVLTGDGLARGYLDPKQNQDRFVEVDLAGNGKMTRAYRTGDYARRRTFDGELDFIGRIDHQMKIRGYRVELGEIEHTILRHSAVGDAVALVQDGGDGEPRIVAFVTLRSEQSQLTPASEGHITARSSDEDDEEMEEVRAWTAIRQNVVYSDVESISLEKLGHDFVGWVSMYDQQEIDRTDMEEWLQDTLRTINDGGCPEHVLEIGTGTGMILFNLEKDLQSYFGLEPVEHAVNFVKSVTQAKSLTGKVTVQVGTANDVDAVQGVMAPTMAIMNSVAQYFPSPDYLHEVIAKLLRLGTVHHLYFGDIRSYALYRQFQVTMARYSVGARPSRMELRKCMKQIVQSEKELLVDPAFFTALQDRYPDLIDHVEIIPRCMEATNELSCYRYAAVIHVRHTDKITRPIHQISDDAWIDFVAEAMDGPALLDRLCAESSASTVAVSNISHSKTFFERSIVESLDSETAENDECLDAFAVSSKHVSQSLSAKELCTIAEQAGYCVEISWARQFSQHGGFDAVFHRVPQDGRRTLFAFPTDHQGREVSSFTNRPLQFRHQRKMEQLLHRHLRNELPSYMVPSVVRVLDWMPVNENRKVDRHVLSKMNTDLKRTRSAVDCVAPRTDTERVLCEEFSAVLRVDVGVTDSFFDLGGHSLMATRAISRINKRLAVDLTIKDLFDCPIVENLGRQVEILLGSAVYKPIPTLVHSDSVVQSFAQSRLWFLDQLYPGSTLYIVSYRLRLRGPLDLSALASAFGALQLRHEMLRTTFGDEDGVGTQTVQPYQSHDLLRVIKVAPDTAARLADIVDQEQSRPFDLRTEPGFRAALFQLGAQDHILSIDLHHIICDGWSIGVLREELAQFYAGSLHGQELSMPGLPIQYCDFAVWQKLPDQLQQQGEQLQYWSRQLEGSQAAEFPCDLPRPTVLSSDSNAVEVVIEAPLFDAVHQYCRAQKTTPFTTLLSVFRATHFRLTGVGDATIGTLVANRNRQELENLVGFFANLQCIRSTVEAGDSFDDLVQQIKTTTTTAFKNQDVPFDKIVANLNLPSRDTSRNPLVQCTFALDSQQDDDRFDLEGLDVEPMHCSRPSRFDIELQLYQEETCFRGFVLYNKDLFRPETIRNLVAVFHKILRQGLIAPDIPIGRLSLTPESSVRSDEQKLQAHGQSTDYPRDESIPDVFRQQVALYSNTVAVKDAVRQLTYAELDYQSDLLARWLIRTQKLTAETLVGVYMPRSCTTIVSFIAILKASLAYLPLDVNVPPARTEAILTSVQAARLLVLEDTVASVPAPIVALEHVQVFRVGDAIACEQTSCEDTLLLQSCSPSATSLAYVMFTSGSTGRPKGVMIEHRGVVRLARQTAIVSRMAVGMKISHLNTIAFDASTWEIFTALLNGATLICVDSLTVLDPSKLSKQFMHDGIQVAELTPALLQLCVNDVPGMLAGLEILVSAGDRLHPHVAKEVRGHTKGAFFNAYGPTENTGFSTLFEILSDKIFTDKVPIGQPIENSGAFVVDDNNHEVPTGVLGELIVTGDGLARGYYMDPQQNHDKFINVTIDNKFLRAYRSGDTVRRRPIDGQLEFFGRIDHQVKMRGYRIELGEVECILRSHKAVDEAVVLVHQGSEDNQRLVAFVTLRSGAGSGVALPADGKGSKDWITEQLHNHVRARLPSYMLPSSIQPLDQFPMNLNGKIDRRALPQLIPIAHEDHRYTKLQVSPRTSTEAVLCSIFSSILHTPIGATDNFFDLGGHSLLAARVVSRINSQLRANLSIFSFYQTATPATIADLLTLAPSPSADSLPQRYMHFQAREHNKATLVLVHGFWGQGTVFLPLVKLLGEELDVVLIHDPYFGTREAPGSIAEWAGRYLSDLIRVVKRDKPVVLGGFSLGGLIAFQMAALWQSKFGRCVDSLLLLDAGGHPALSTYFARQEMPTSSLEHALGIFGERQRELVVEHFEKHRAMSFGNIDDMVFEGDGLCLVTPGSSSASWWAGHCPNMKTQVLDCAHYEVLGCAMVGRVAELVRQHYNWK